MRLDRPLVTLIRVGCCRKCTDGRSGLPTATMRSDTRRYLCSAVCVTGAEERGVPPPFLLFPQEYTCRQTARFREMHIAPSQPLMSAPRRHRYPQEILARNRGKIVRKVALADENFHAKVAAHSRIAWDNTGSFCVTHNLPSNRTQTWWCAECNHSVG